MNHREPKPATYLAAVLMDEWRNSANLATDLYHPVEMARDAETLVRLGKRAARIAEQRCNGIDRYDAKAGRVLASWTEDDDARADKAEVKIFTAASDILAKYGATIERVGGDPRGFNLTFRLASGRSNSFGGKVWGV